MKIPCASTVPEGTAVPDDAKPANDPVVHLLRGHPQASPGVLNERRDRPDRRMRLWWSVVYGSFNPRRRRPARRGDDGGFHSLDWHASHLMAVAIGIPAANVIADVLPLPETHCFFRFHMRCV